MKIIVLTFENVQIFNMRYFQIISPSTIIYIILLENKTTFCKKKKICLKQKYYI